MSNLMNCPICGSKNLKIFIHSDFCGGRTEMVECLFCGESARSTSWNQEARRARADLRKELLGEILAANILGLNLDETGRKTLLEDVEAVLWEVYGPVIETNHNPNP